MNRNYNSLDVTKFVMSIFVVVIHCFIINDVTGATNVYIGNGLNTMLTQAVPFFFATSAFLLFGKMKDCKEEFSDKVRKYLAHIVRMYVVWFFIFTITAVVGMDGADIGDYLVDRSYAMFFWGGGHLWYLWAMLLVLPIISTILIRFGGVNFTLCW